MKLADIDNEEERLKTICLILSYITASNNLRYDSARMELTASELGPATELMVRDIFMSLGARDTGIGGGIVRVFRDQGAERVATALKSWISNLLAKTKLHNDLSKSIV